MSICKSCGKVDAGIHTFNGDVVETCVECGKEFKYGILETCPDFTKICFPCLNFELDFTEEEE